MAAPQEVKQEYHDPAIPLPSIYTEENWKQMFNKNLYISVHKAIHNVQKAETTQMFIN
jgi:hypothetical protein